MLSRPNVRTTVRTTLSIRYFISRLLITKSSTFGAETRVRSKTGNDAGQVPSAILVPGLLDICELAATHDRTLFVCRNLSGLREPPNF